jgi:hypothetical protein
MIDACALPSAAGLYARQEALQKLVCLFPRLPVNAITCPRPFRFPLDESDALQLRKVLGYRGLRKRNDINDGPAHAGRPAGHILQNGDTGGVGQRFCEIRNAVLAGAK